MRLASVLALVLIIFSGVTFWAHAEPCEKPITYTLGTFDNRFNISEAQFLQAITRAESLWEDAVDKELFQYSAQEGKLPINLVYDYRQETTDTLEHIDEELKDDEATYKELQGRYSRIKVEYESAKSTYDERIEAFNTKNDAYQVLVEEWNNSNRRDKARFQELEDKRLALEQEAANIKELERALNAQVREINSVVASLNRIAQALNLGADTYNTIGAARGETFTGGLFYHSETEYGIDIFEFQSEKKLVRVLAHELGHALGLDHTSEVNSIMYELNKSEDLSLSPSDLTLLRNLCQLEPST